MIWKSRYPVRLLLVCPVCKESTTVDRDDWIKAQTFCPKDNEPMIVRGVAVGVPLTNDWPELFGSIPPASPLDFSRCVKPQAVMRAYALTLC